ncbi:MAG TPA: hypothetical protein DCX54_07430 [Flavobacteriales bacterium]|nr:hypothetical protein [Flavobacteriales bacterium]
MKKYALLLLLPSFIFQIGCTKEEDDPTPTVATIPYFTINLSHVVSGEPMVFNQRIYQTPANNPYEVRHLEYFISDFKLKNQTGQWLTVQSEPKLIDPQDDNIGTRTVLLNVPIGTYQGISCMIGIPEAINYTGYLPQTVDNMNMAWPDPIGGGYHFMKFEGNYQDENLEWKGFTVHLGKNGNQAPNTIKDISIAVSATSKSLDLVMDMNQWFDNPHYYDFNVQGNYTMAVDSLMLLVSENGRNCLSVKQ